MKRERRRFNIVLRPEPEGGFTAMVPALPGCVTYGRTLVEARSMVKDAVSGYIASLQKHNEPIPSDEETLVASLDMEYGETASRSTAYGFEVFGTKRLRSRSRFGKSSHLLSSCSKRRAVLAQHNRDIPVGTLLSLLREAGFTKDQFVGFIKEH